jgi:RNA polymerase sigma factor (sigma-70 family)
MGGLATRVAPIELPCQNHGMDMDNAELLSQYARDRNPRLRDRILIANMGLARKQTHKFAKNSREPYEDLEQVAVMGLLKAIEFFDVTKGFKFSTYAVPKIRSEIQHYLRDKCEPVKIPRSWVDNGGEVRRLTEAGLTDCAIAQQIKKIKAEELPMLRQALKRRPLVSLDKSEDGDRALEVADEREHLNLVSIECVLAMASEIPNSGYFDATAICRKHQREFYEFWRLPSTQKRVKELQNTGLSRLYKSRPGRGGGTQLHVALAVEFLSWVHPSYKEALRTAAYGNLAQLYGDAG